MSRAPLAKAAGPLVLLTGSVIVVTRLITMLTIPSDPDALRAAVLEPAHAMNSVGSVAAFALLVIALFAMYDWQATAAGWLGLIGLAAATTGTVFLAGDWWYEAFAVPWLADVAPIVFETGAGGRLLVGGVSSFAFFALGWMIFGAASFRARVFPTAISLSILVSGLLAGIPIAGAYLYGGVLFGATLCALGAWMLRTHAVPDVRVQPATA